MDYRYLNSQTKDDPFPLHLIEDLVYKQARNAIWTIFDLEDGFHQMHLAPKKPRTNCFCDFIRFESFDGVANGC